MLKIVSVFPVSRSVARGGDGAGPPRAALLGGGKIEDIPKNLEKGKVF